MITPIRTMKINDICQRKDDLLMSADDIEGIAKNVRAKAIDEFAEKLSFEISESIIWDMLATMSENGSLSDTSDKIVDYVTETSQKIAEQLKAGEHNG